MFFMGRKVNVNNIKNVILLFGLIGTNDVRGYAASSPDKRFTNNRKIPSEEIRKELEVIRRNADEIRNKWIEDEENWRKLPARAWPERQPNVDEIPQLEKEYVSLCGGSSTSGGNHDACKNITFDMATALLFNNMDTEKGLQLYESLANKGDVRGLTAAGICYVEGLGVPFNEEKGSKMIKCAAENNFVQAIYELGSLHYNGNAEPFIEEDVNEAFRLFNLAASQNHTSGLYMTAEMLLIGEGCDKQDIPRAIRLLYRAGERGHRTARATMWSLLREYED